MKTRTHITAGEDSPSGSYTRSCSWYHYMDGVLVGNCKTKDRQENISSLSIPWDYEGEISNCNGTLVLGDCL